MRMITITLSRVVYRGESIGRDIRIETSIAGKDTTIDKRIPHGSSVSLSHIIATINTEDIVLSGDLSLTVIEKDLMWSDRGQTTVTIEAKTESPRIKEQTVVIPVQERRTFFGWLLGKTKTAQFELTLRVEVHEATHMIARTDDGWLKVVPEWQKEIISLPEFLRVHLLEQKDGRDYFRILEGSYAHRQASVLTSFESDKPSLVKSESSAPAVEAEYSIAKRTVTLNGITHDAKDYDGAPWQKGTYLIYIPDSPHLGGLHYSEKYPHARTWFLVGFESERYLHVGAVSLGCITISADQDWEELYEILIRSRAGDGKSIGMLKVVD